VPRHELESVQDYLRICPRICCHIIRESLGYACPTLAARILKDANEGRENCSEWVWSCYDRDPKIRVQRAIKNRHTHHGYMAEYKLARALVERAIKAGEEPLLGSWF
jgi:hypothetical protein